MQIDTNATVTFTHSLTYGHYNITVPLHLMPYHSTIIHIYRMLKCIYSFKNLKLLSDVVHIYQTLDSRINNL